MTIKRKEKGEHTCPEVLIKLSELIKGLVTNTNYNLTILSVFTLLKYGQIVIGIYRDKFTQLDKCFRTGVRTWVSTHTHLTTDYRF